MEKLLYSEPYKSCAMMGALRIAANFENSICIINGPSGCSFFCRNTVLQINGYIHPIIKSKNLEIYTTAFDENDVIFGANKKLVKIINQIYDKKHPEMIFIFNCCVSEVIGEDLDEVKFNLEKEIDSIIVPVKSAGFKGDHRFGMKMMNEMIFEKLIKGNIRKKIECSVNILGEMDVNYSTTKELTRILKEGGITILSRILGRVGITEINQSVNADLNIVICGSAAMELARRYNAEFQIPYIKGSRLYSIDKTFEAYKEIYEYFDLPIDNLIIHKNKAMELIENFKEKLQNKKVFIIAGARRAIGYAEVLKELEVEITYIFSESNESYIEKADFENLAEEVMCDEWDLELRKKIETKKPDLVISTIPELTMPIRTVSRVIDDFSGFEGTVRMAKYIVEILEKKRGTVYWQTIEN